jgi:hypothetical protein
MFEYKGIVRLLPYGMSGGNLFEALLKLMVERSMKSKNVILELIEFLSNEQMAVELSFLFLYS